MSTRLLRLLPLLAALVAGDARATTVVRFLPGDASLDANQETTLQIVADFDQPILGFGLDLVLTGASVLVLDDLVVGASWTPVAAPDGDGLAGLAPVTGLVGTDVLLATVTLRALVPGTTVLGGAITPGDLTEGFALLGGGFDDVVFEPAVLEVLPEPASGLLLLCGLALGLRPPRRSAAPDGGVPTPGCTTPPRR